MIEGTYTVPELHRATNSHPSFLRRRMRGLTITQLEELPLIYLNTSDAWGARVSIARNARKVIATHHTLNRVERGVVQGRRTTQTYAR